MFQLRINKLAFSICNAVYLFGFMLSVLVLDLVIVLHFSLTKIINKSFITSHAISLGRNDPVAV